MTNNPDIVAVLEEVKMRLAQIASSDYKACGVFAEDVAKEAFTKLTPVIEQLKATQEDKE